MVAAGFVLFWFGPWLGFATPGPVLGFGFVLEAVLGRVVPATHFLLAQSGCSSKVA